MAIDSTAKAEFVMPEGKKSTPPLLANWLASKFINESLLEEFLGDLKELYDERLVKRGRFYAKWMFWVDALYLLIGFTSFHFFRANNNPTILYKHYLIVAARNIYRNKFFSLINIAGLAVGMSACLMIYQYIHFELSYDKFHSNVDNIYRLTQSSIRNSEVNATDVFTSHALGVRAKESIPEINRFVRIHYHEDGGAVIANPDNDEPFEEDQILFVDSTFLDVFDFPLKMGNRTSVLSGKHHMVITEQAATKYFGTADPIGKTLEVRGNWVDGDFKVVGVLKAIPINSHLQFDFLLSMASLLDNYQYRNSTGWGWSNFVTYISVAKDADLNVLGEKFDQVITTYNGENLARTDTEIRTGFQTLSDIHLRSNFDRDPAIIGSIQDVYTFSIIGVFILIIAWINYINLSTARSINRAREVGIRKSIGAFKKELIVQFLIESLFINLICACLSIAIVFLTLPILNNLVSTELELVVLETIQFWIWFSILILCGSVLAGIYPAFVLSSFNPLGVIDSFKKNQRGNFNLRKGLIVFQFLASAILISGTYLVYDQVTFMKNQELGINTEHILVVTGPRVGFNNENIESKLQAFKNSVISHHSISGVTGSGMVPSKGFNWQAEIYKMGDLENEYEIGKINWVDLDFTETYNLQFLTGRPFKPNDRLDVLIDEESVRSFGLGTPENALNQKLIVGGDTVAVVGVLKNFHWNSVKDQQMPFLFASDDKCSAYFSIKLDLSNIQESISHIENSYNEVFGGNPFNYFFLDDEFNQQYQSDLQFGNLFSIFTFLSIIIAFIGLFALVSVSAASRIKEISIRKVLGARVTDLMVMLSKEYLKLLLIAVILAIPAVLYLGKAWLENYTYRTTIGFDVLIIPAFALMLISILTVSHRTYSAAKSSPINTLRTQ